VARRKWDPRQFVLNTLRRKSYMLPALKEAMDAARVAFGIYRCASCERPTPRKLVEKDHEPPVIPIDGWDSYDGVVRRWLGETSRIQILCLECHRAKSKAENAERRKARKGKR
jgi:hypothetical protein